jgi:hypothetical protein
MLGHHCSISVVWKAARPSGDCCSLLPSDEA